MSAARLRLKICCIGSRVEAAMAVAAGADALGLVSAMPSGPGVIEETLIREIAGATADGVATFLLTSRCDAAGIARQHGRCATTTIQIVDWPEPGTWQALQAAVPGVELVQVIHVTDEEALRQAESASAHVDALLLDSGNPDLERKELGGTGRVHDWGLSRRIVADCPVPVLLAGGLRPDNVAAAVAAVRPAGVDVCSGVRSQGRLDAEKLDRFVRALRG